MPQLALTIALCLLAAGAPAAGATVPSEINGVWGDVSWELRYGRAPTAADGPAERVRVHLEEVLVLLRDTGPLDMPVDIANRRAASLAALREYVAIGAYPRNVDEPFARSEFIGADEALCAVGAMVAATAGREAAEAIDAAFNRDSVWAMDDPRVAAWAEAHGFTPLELALIQPMYPPEWHHPRYHSVFAIGARVGAVVAGASNYRNSFEGLTKTADPALDLGLLMLWQPGVHWGVGLVLNFQSNLDDYYEGDHAAFSLNLMGEYCAPLLAHGDLDLILYLELGGLFLPGETAFSGVDYGGGLALELPLGFTRTHLRVDLRALGYHLWSQPGRTQEIDGVELIATVGAMFRFD